MKNLPDFLVERINQNQHLVRPKAAVRKSSMSASDIAAMQLSRSRNIQRQMGVQQQQSSLGATVLGALAVAFVDSDAVTPVYRSQRGFANSAITRSSAGVYVLTLLDAISLTLSTLITATPVHTTFASIAVGLTSATTLTTSTAALAVAPTITATDLDYFIKVEEIGPA